MQSVCVREEKEEKEREENCMCVFPAALKKGTRQKVADKKAA
jgi:hypothetical protein